MIAGMASARKQVTAIVHDLEALYFRLLGVQSFLPPDDAELDRFSEMDATDPATRLRAAIACVLKDSLETAIRDLEAATSPSSRSNPRDDEETWDEGGRDLNGSGNDR